jgi:putative endonuclease
MRRPRKSLSATRLPGIYNEKMFYVYVLHSIADRGLYIGYSADLKNRLSEHKRGASRATRYRGPWKMIYYEAYFNRQDAEGRERYLKSGGGRRFLSAAQALF